MQRLEVICSTRLVSEELLFTLLPPPGRAPDPTTATRFAAPDVGVPENIAHLYFHQLINGLVSCSVFYLSCLLEADPRLARSAEIHLHARHLPPRHQARELPRRRQRFVVPDLPPCHLLVLTASCFRQPQDRRLWSCDRVQVQGPDPAAQRPLREPALRRARTGGPEAVRGRAGGCLVGGYLAVCAVGWK